MKLSQRGKCKQIFIRNTCTSCLERDRALPSVVLGLNSHSKHIRWVRFHFAPGTAVSHPRPPEPQITPQSELPRSRWGLPLPRPQPPRGGGVSLLPQKGRSHLPRRTVVERRTGHRSRVLVQSLQPRGWVCFLCTKEKTYYIISKAPAHFPRFRSSCLRSPRLLLGPSFRESERIGWEGEGRPGSFSPTDP